MLTDRNAELDNSAAEKRPRQPQDACCCFCLEALCCVGGSDISEELSAWISPDAAAEPISMNAAVKIHIDLK